MASSTQTVLLLGDQNDAFVDGIDYLYKQAETQPWLRSFLADNVAVVKDEMSHWDHTLRETLGVFHTFQELSEKFRYGPDDIGMAHGLLVFIMRQAMLLQCVKREPSLITKAETIPICGGLLNTAALDVASDFDTLYEASLEMTRVLCRVSRLAYYRSRATEVSKANWGWTVIGISAEKLQIALDNFQRSMGIPAIKKVRVAVIGQGWSTIIGPPSVLEKVLKQCPAVKALPKQEMNIRALHHSLALSDSEIEELLGSSLLLDTQVGDSTWRSTVKEACVQILTKPFNIITEVAELAARLNPSTTTVDLNVIGLSTHDKFIADSLKSAGKTVKTRYEHTVAPTPNFSVSASIGDRIAIVGMASRAPGADDLSDFWRIIVTGQDVHREIPPDRFDIADFFSASHAGKCTTNARHGCFIDRPGVFDARFFNISQREALLMEPAHRLWLMAVYEALEMSGYSQGRTRATDPARIGAFFGQSVDDWRAVSHSLGCDAYVMQGMQRAFGPGRVNFHFKWEGPTYSLDSACASSASAITLACQNLVSGECDMAVAGGGNIMSSPHTFSALSRAGVLSTTGGCKTYRDDADGYCRGDFAGAVVLKRLEDAVTDNDNILAVISASGRNHAGNAPSITTSDAGSQERLFRQVLRKAQVSPEDVDYVEMHGTGTQVGDLAEMTAVTNTFKRSKDAKEPLRVGAVKANVGHCEAAAGIASLIKCILSLQEEFIPPVANMPHKLNPKFPDLKALNVEIPVQRADFKPQEGGHRRMILNNFDASGGNTCLLIEDYIRPEKTGADPRSCHVVTLSAKSASSHIEGKKRLLNFLRASVDDHRIEDLAYTTTARRIHYPIRTAITASSVKEVIDKLDADIKSEAKVEKVSTAAPVVFMFTGQGSHYAGMGAELYKTSPVFRDSMNLSVAICKQHGFPEFLDIITSPDTDMGAKDTAQTQLAVVCLEIALSAFWKAAGVEPAMVMGHSLGEYAALHVAGVLSLTDVLYLVGERAKLVLERCVPCAFSMLSVFASADRVGEYVRKQSSCEIACVNSPRATVVSGSAEKIGLLKAELEKDGVRSRELSMPYGFHSVQVDPVLDDYAALARGVVFSAPRVPVASTLTAVVVEKAGVVNEMYLMRQTRERVDYVGALGAVAEKLKNPVFLEVGPSRVLGSFVQATLDSVSSDKIVSTLESAKEKEWTSLSKSLCALYKAGLDVDWTALHEPYTSGVKVITLPSYVWDLKDYWIKWSEPREPQLAIAAAPVAAATAITTIERPLSSVLHYVVSKVLTPKLEITFKSLASDPNFAALIKGHRLRGVPVCPGGAFCEMGMEAAQFALKAKGDKRTDLAILTPSFNRPFTMPSGSSTAEILTTITMPTNDTLTAIFKVSTGPTSYDIGGCSFRIVDNAVLQSDWDKTAYFIKSRMDGVIRSTTQGDGHRFKPSIFYSLFSNTVEYDSPYKGVQEAYVSADFREAAAEVVLQVDPSGPTSSSPYWSDSLVHLAGFVANANPTRPAGSTFMMDGFAKSEQTARVCAGEKYFSYVRVTKFEGDSFYCDVFVFDGRSDRIVMQCSNLHFHEVENATLERVLGKVDGGGAAAKAVAAPVKSAAAGTKSAAVVVPKVKTVKKKVAKKAAAASGPNVLDTLLASIAAETGTELAELTDDAVLSELGVDSIMAIQIAGTVKMSTGFEIPGTFVFEYPSIGDLKKEFASAKGEIVSDADADAEEEETEEEVEEVVSAPVKAKKESGPNVLDILLHSIAAETATDMAELTDDAMLSELGVDSIMAIQIAGTVKNETGVEIPGTFVFEFPTIGDLRGAFGDLEGSASSVGSSSGRSSPVQDDTDVTDADEPAPEPKKTAPAPDKATTKPAKPDENSLVKDYSVFKFSEENQEADEIDFATVPKAKIVLMQGRPSSSPETPLFLIPDGSGTAATYIHLPPFKSGLPIYAIESPFLRCPGKLSRKTGIPGLAKLIVEAILKLRPSGPYLIGGYSGGATISYEVCRQLTATGRKIQGLLLIDMCCPREMTDTIDSIPEQGLAILMRLSPPDKRSFWTSSMAGQNAQQHQRQIVRAVCHYNPPPMEPADRPARVVIIWGRRGLIERAKADTKVLGMMSKLGVQTETVGGFMMDPRIGPVAWSVPSKKESDLGPNGWDRFVGEELKILVAEADHLSMPVPPDVKELHRCIEEALPYLNEVQ